MMDWGQVREYIDLHFQRVDERFLAQEKAVAAALAAAKEAVAKAEAASEKRFEGVNEFRGTLSDQQRTLMPRAEAEMRMGQMEGRIGKLEQSDIQRIGQQSGSQTVWA
jgi:TolA-binding protein